MKRLFRACLAGVAVIGVVAGSQVVDTTASAAGITDNAPVSDAACLVPASGVMECFSSVAALQVQAAADGVSPDTSCPLYLYSGATYSGRVLEIDAQGYWLNLSDYGFDNTTVSFIGSGCGFHLAQNINGGGYWYPGNTGAWSYCPNMGAGWNDVISSVYVA